MDKTIIKKVNQYIRKKRPILSPQIICDTYQNNTFLEIAFISKGCRNDLKGSCIMCDYGATYGSKSKEVYLNEMNSILEKAQNVQYLLLCANGSIMDEYQLSEEIFKSVLENVGITAIPNIIIETHYKDINTKKLEYIKKFLRDKNITIELGLETANQNYQDSLIMKEIIMEEIEKKIKEIQQLEMNVDLNIMLGLPFLSEKEQIEDSLATVNWAIEHNCNPVIFPLNIKPFTLLYHMYQTGYYQPISLWLVVLLLSLLEPMNLERVTISYYGNRTDEYLGIEEETIYPYTCPKCYQRIMDFFESFFHKNNWQERHNLLKEILTWNGCNCLANQRNLLMKKNTTTFNDLIDNYINTLVKDYSFLFSRE